MTKRIIQGITALVFGVGFWLLWDNAPRDHIPFDFLDNRSLLGLLAWACVGVATDYGSRALRGIRLKIPRDGDAA